MCQYTNFDDHDNNDHDANWTNPFREGSQLFLLLEHFLAHPRQWHAMPELTSICRSYVIHSKIAELRRLGIGTFENRMVYTERNGRRVAMSYYLFTPNPAIIAQ